MRENHCDARLELRMTSTTKKESFRYARTCGLVLLLIIMPALVLVPGGLCAQQPAPSEYEIKAAYLYNFGKFVRWPAKAEAASKSFVVCVLGQDPFGPALKTILAGQSIDGEETVATTISKPEDAGSCRILFISSSEEHRLRDIISALDDSSVLTVSDLPSFSKKGGMVGFVFNDNKIRFEVNLGKAQRAGLTMSSELLKLAVAVRNNPVGN